MRDETLVVSTTLGGAGMSIFGRRLPNWQVTAAAAVFFVVATVVMTWPLAWRSGSTVQDPGDPLFQIWVMRSVQHRLVSDPLDLYDANGFYPYGDSLAFSEEAISTALVAWPVYLVSGNEVLAYNLMVLLSFWLVGFGVYLLAKELGAAPGAALVGGLAAAFAPARFGHMSHLNILSLGWLPVSMWAFTVFIRRGERKYAAIGGAALAIQLLASLHLAVFATIALAGYIVALLVFERLERAWRRRDDLTLVLALGLPYLLFVPTLLPHVALQRRYDFERSREEIDQLAATPDSYLSVHAFNHFWTRWLDIKYEPFFPGAIVLVGACVALFTWRRWPMVYLVLLAAGGALLSFGFSVDFAGRTIPMPYTALYDLFPPIKGIRGVARFGLLFALALPLLAAFGYTWLWNRVRGRFGEWAALWGVGLVGILVVALFVELRTDVGTDPVPNDANTVAVYEWLDDQSSGPLIEFPADGLLLGQMAPPDGVFQPIRYLYESTRHWNPVLAGYSSYVPPSFWELLTSFAAKDGVPSGVTPNNVGLLQDLGIRWVVVHHYDGYDWQQALATADTLPQLQRVADVGDSTVYALAPAPAERAKPGPPSFVLADAAPLAGLYTVTVRFNNSGDTPILGWLDRHETVRVAWMDESGNEVMSEKAKIDFPVTLGPGESFRTADVYVPKTPGIYTVRAWIDGEAIPPVEQVVQVQGGSGAVAPTTGPRE